MKLLLLLLSLLSPLALGQQRQSEKIAAKIPNLTGVTDGSSAAAGEIGEYKSNVSSTQFVGNTSSGWSVTTISIRLTAGDWDIRAMGQVYIAGATGTGVSGRFGAIRINNVTDSIQEVGTRVSFANSDHDTNMGSGTLTKRISITEEKVYRLEFATFNNSGSPAITTLYLVGGTFPNYIEARRVR